MRSTGFEVAGLILGFAGAIAMFASESNFIKMVGLVAVFAAGTLIARYFIVRWCRERQRARTILLVNGLLAPTARVVKVLEKEPTMTTKPLDDNENEGQSPTAHETELREYETDDGVAATDRASLQTYLNGPSPVIRLQAFPFTALRQRRALAHSEGDLPLTVSALTIALDDETRNLIVQRRAENAYVYPGLLGAIGGLVRTLRPLELRDHSFSGTVRREFSEEIGDGPLRFVEPWYVSEDAPGGFIQVGPLVSVWEADGPPHPPGIEGRPEVLDDRALEVRLADPTDWTPGTYLRVVTWLGMGAPQGSPNMRKNAKRLVELAMNSVEAYGLFHGPVFYP